MRPDAAQHERVRQPHRHLAELRKSDRCRDGGNSVGLAHGVPAGKAGGFAPGPRQGLGPWNRSSTSVSGGGRLAVSTREPHLLKH